jgi:ribosomal protein S30
MPGTHGSLTKAGKVRSATPKVERHGVNSRGKKIPRVRFKKIYTLRVQANRFGGQPASMNAMKFQRQQRGPRGEER